MSFSSSVKCPSTYGGRYPGMMKNLDTKKNMWPYKERKPTCDCCKKEFEHWRDLFLHLGYNQLPFDDTDKG